MLETMGAAVFDGSSARRSTVGGSSWAADPTCRTSSVQAFAAEVLRRMTGSGCFELGPSGGAISRQRLVVCAAASL
jgi:hypothetical protein